MIRHILLAQAYPAQISFKQEPLDFRRECLSHSLSLLMSSFSLVISPPDGSRPGFIDEPLSSKVPRRVLKRIEFFHTTLRYHALLHPELRLMA